LSKLEQLVETKRWVGEFAAGREKKVYFSKEKHEFYNYPVKRVVATEDTLKSRCEMRSYSYLKKKSFRNARE